MTQEILHWTSLVFACVGALFFLTGSIGLGRLPDIPTRLHALSKADNVGLGFLALACIMRADTLQIAFKASLVWALMLITSACLCTLIVRESICTEEDGGT